jgi:hypothetical protein
MEVIYNSEEYFEATVSRESGLKMAGNLKKNAINNVSDKNEMYEYKRHCKKNGIC